MNNVDLHLGDCLEFLKILPDGCVDAVVTDPPFGIGFYYNGKREIAANPKDYWIWLEPIYHECRRVAKPGALIAFWQAQSHFKHFWEWFGEEIHIYCAAKNFVQLRRMPFNYGYEPVVMQYKGGAEPLRPAKPRRNLDYFVANTAGVISDTTRIEKAHPCPRPLDAVVEILENFVVPGGTVLDCFAGSGTTGVACVQTGRRFIGCEIDPGYFEIAKRRIEQAQAQLQSEIV